MMRTDLVKMSNPTRAARELEAAPLVSKATSGSAGTPDWNAILQILGILETHPDVLPSYLSAISKSLVTAPRRVQLNTLMLIDALFKNSKGPILASLPSPVLLRALSDPAISDDPELHNFLQKSTPAWVANCAAHDAVDSRFLDWQNTVCQERFVPRLTEEVKSKLSADIETAMEVLHLFSDLLLAVADQSKASERILTEILPSVREITRRTGDLEPTIVDSRFHVVVAAVHQLGLAAQQAWSELKRSGQFDLTKWQLAVETAQRLVGINLVVGEGSGDQKRAPVRRRKGAIEDISVGEFFVRFDQIKGSKPPDLLDLGAPSAGASLIDSLIEI
jgi:hypothetical protein